MDRTTPRRLTNKRREEIEKEMQQLMLCLPGTMDVEVRELFQPIRTSAICTRLHPTSLVLASRGRQAMRKLLPEAEAHAVGTELVERGHKKLKDAEKQ